MHQIRKEKTREITTDVKLAGNTRILTDYAQESRWTLIFSWPHVEASSHGNEGGIIP